jgi:hypothetical protein
MDTHFLAISRTAKTSLTPPSRQASIWQKSIASACRSCLNRTRFWQCSPVATFMPYGCNAFRMAAWPRTSSGDVGSSIKLCLPHQQSLFTMNKCELSAIFGCYLLWFVFCKLNHLLYRLRYIPNLIGVRH